MIKRFSPVTLSEIEDVVQYLVTLTEKHNIFAFYGSMGAGKTTLISLLVNRITGKNIQVTSPTFALVNVYEGDKTIYHFDCYRLEKPEEALQAGLEDMMYDGSLCFIEWPEKIESLLPENIVLVHITETDNPNARMVEINTSDYD